MVGVILRINLAASVLFCRVAVKIMRWRRRGVMVIIRRLVPRLVGSRDDWIARRIERICSHELFLPCSEFSVHSGKS
jgi:hypothetical protein